jgi:molecular chaperone GrpE
VVTAAGDPLALTEQLRPLPPGLEAYALEAGIGQLLIRLARAGDDLEAAEARRVKEQRGLLLDLLPIGDALDRLLAFAVAQRDGDEVFEKLFEAAQMTRRMFLDQLERQRVTRIAVVGLPFDPSSSEALGCQAGTGLPDDTVVSEVVAGYLWDGEMLRKAKVVVSKG